MRLCSSMSWNDVCVVCCAECDTVAKIKIIHFCVYKSKTLELNEMCNYLRYFLCCDTTI